MASPGTKRAALDESTNQDAQLGSPAQRQKVANDPRGPPPPAPGTSKGKGAVKGKAMAAKGKGKGGKGKGKPPPPPGMRPPPPPGGPGASNLPRPPQPMKAVSWSKLSNNKIAESIWAPSHTAHATLKVDHTLLDMFFADYEAIKANAGNAAPKPKKATADRIKFLDGKRSQNVAIVSSSVKLSNDELRLALFLHPDAVAKLSPEIVERLLTMCP